MCQTGLRDQPGVLRGKIFSELEFTGSKRAIRHQVIPCPCLNAIEKKTDALMTKVTTWAPATGASDGSFPKVNQNERLNKIKDKIKDIYIEK